MSLLFAIMLAAAAPAAAAPGDSVVPDCEVHKFEAPVTITANGQTKQSKVKICGHIGQNDAQWVDTLKDARAKLEADLKMPLGMKEQVVSALNIEIARLGVAVPKEPAPAAELPLISVPSSAGLSGLSQPVRTPQSTQPLAEYSSLPPMPAPKPQLSAVAAAAAAPPTLPPVRLTFRCMSTNNLAGEGACDLLERETLVTVRADENVPNGTSLRFVRRGDNRAEVELAALKLGQKQQFVLPARVCQGVTGSRVEIQVVRAAGKATQVVDTRGPYELRC